MFGLRAALVSLLALAAAPVVGQEVQRAEDDTFLTVSGVVESVVADAFDLNYGEGIITVEFDDGDRDADAYVLDEGDEVTVYGVIDDDLYETRTIEASRVYVESIGTYFYASPMDEEDAFVHIDTDFDPGEISIQGTVTAIDDEEFMVDRGVQRTLVEIDDLFYDPLDDVGYQQIDIGDRVFVTGEMDYDLFEGRELVADSIVVLAD